MSSEGECEIRGKFHGSRLRGGTSRSFPDDVQSDMLDALTLAAEGGKSDKAKPFKGVDGGVFEIALRHRGDAFRAIYAVRIGADLWVIHAFQKKSKTGIKTPKAAVDLIRERLKRLKE